MIRKLFKIIIPLLIYCSQTAFAFVEFHTHYGSSKSSPSTFNDAYYKAKTGPELTKQSFLGFDAIARYGAFPLRMGLRYESLSEDATDNGETVIMVGSRLAGVLNLRFINQVFYMGFIGTYGLAHDLNIDFKNGGDRFSTSSGKSSSLGLEGGVKWGPLRLGAEIGHLRLIYSNLKNKAGVTPSANGVLIDKMDFTAPYYKFIIGVGF